MSESLTRTKKWVKEVVIDYGLCPFAPKPFAKGLIHYLVESRAGLETALYTTAKEIEQLAQNNDVETTLIIFEQSLSGFDDFLDFIAMAEQLLEDLGHQHLFLFAHFHPHYQFDGLEYHDAANYSNRSPKPILQLLRHSSIDNAQVDESDLEKIPERNIRFLRDKGADHLKSSLERISKA